MNAEKKKQATCAGVGAGLWACESACTREAALTLVDVAVSSLFRAAHSSSDEKHTANGRSCKETQQTLTLVHINFIVFVGVLLEIVHTRVTKNRSRTMRISDNIDKLLYSLDCVSAKLRETGKGEKQKKPTEEKKNGKKKRQQKKNIRSDTTGQLWSGFLAFRRKCIARVLSAL